MKYLVDTNVWLELLLEQERAGEARRFLEIMDGGDLVLSGFSLYSIGLVLIRLNKGSAFQDFLEDTLQQGDVHRLVLALDGLMEIHQWMRRFRLDFDDAYQYSVAEGYELTIVSFDSDFDRTERGRKTPSQIVEQQTQQS
jgi:hypothetical protein